MNGRIMIFVIHVVVSHRGDCGKPLMSVVCCLKNLIFAMSYAMLNMGLYYGNVSAKFWSK